MSFSKAKLKLKEDFLLLNIVLNTSPSVLTGLNAVLTFSWPRIRRILSETPLTYGIKSDRLLGRSF